MKLTLPFRKAILFFALTSFLVLNTSAQCTESASSFGNNTSTQSYNISGDVSVVLNANGTSVNLDFGSNFSTASGPDVRAYLIKSEGKTNDELKGLNPTTVDNISFGLVGFSGVQSYTANIPNGADITKYDTVFFYCLQYTAFWDYGKYTPFTANSCSILNVEKTSLTNFSFYPNPAKNSIQFTNVDMAKTEIRIFDVLGKQVYHQPKEKGTNKLDLSNLNTGIYLLSVIKGDKKTTRKLVIE
ncbi:putative secreted protein (Por secretion system target) [Lutibacter sp. Hel_I_33_5]|uniref:T9SS type A sorting domain-containing protein n=1 Tax=Lutibacter sp. Hel_I_33_5 TaxID=1566289 RepID=UPI00119C978A|nr:T9SS type A sorting domain-containing protein [Lutibacter sp. Hel_I_33_5]TVZ56831.1 putative secreted protein (Por secretion system target) [Lutibacter sp. Hel_I_33_5]